MAKKSASIENKLTALAELNNDIAAGKVTGMVAPLSFALGDRSNLVVAKAAEVCAALRCQDAVPDLLESYQRLLKKDPSKSDKGCLAKSAIVKALYELDYLDAAFHRAGTRYIQMEPGWGGQEDVARDIRSTCALGLAASNDYRAIMDLVRLLHDGEPQVRISAVRAIGTLAPVTAEAALRQKALSGDASAAVIDECFRELLKIEPDEAVPFIAEFFDTASEEVREFAALALGESRLPEAFEVLKDLFKNSVIPKVSRTVLIHSMGLARIDPAIDLLIELIESGSREDAATAETILSSFSGPVQCRVADAKKGRQ